MKKSFGRIYYLGEWVGGIFSGLLLLSLWLGVTFMMSKSTGIFMRRWFQIRYYSVRMYHWNPMNNMKLPIPYQIIIKDLHDKSFEGKVEVKDARHVLLRKFRVGKINFTRVINEMMQLGLLDYTDCQTIIIKWKPRKKR